MSHSQGSNFQLSPFHHFLAVDILAQGKMQHSHSPQYQHFAQKLNFFT